MHALPHSGYYQDRRNEAALIADFPGDELLIGGLHAMPAYFATRHAGISIPVTRVMNTAHFTANYMFSTPCVDQREYDAVVYNSLGCDNQLTVITLIVLAAMLKREIRPRARTCRSVLMEDRDEDFYDGVSLYERFLSEGPDSLPFRVKSLSRSEVQWTSVEQWPGVGFPVEYFETDVMDELIALRQENRQLKIKYQLMENQQNNQYNIGTQNNYMGCTINNYYAQPDATMQEGEEPAAEPQNEPVCSPLFMPKALKENKVEEIVQALQRSLSGRQDKARALVQAVRQWQREGYIDTNYNARVMYDELNRILTLPFRYDGFRKYYNE